MANKRNLALTIIGVLICVCAVLGVSYAYWVLVLQQKDSNIVSSDCFSIEFEEGETISLQNTFPIAYSQLLEFFKLQPFIILKLLTSVILWQKVL